ncbi:hypothetical protein LMH73_009865 [Vibrio splendidus]|nr:hypothetical protein [Vibrio splendidus]MCC4878461.1 hypothetical protein [Vibrio splendidus]
MNTKQLPSITDVRMMIRLNPTSSKRDKIMNAFLINDSDESGQMIIAAVIEPRKRIKSTSFTNNYHSKFTSESQKPHFNGRRVDIQFYYLNEELPSSAISLT